MSHLHIPDGVLAPMWLLGGFGATAVVLFFATAWLKGEGGQRRLPRLGVVTAFMLLAMSIPLGFLPAHLNLTVLAGMLLGPWLGVMAVFVANLFLALVGHGGLSVLGLNTMVLGSEVVVGYYLFRLLRSRIHLVGAAALATCLTLTLSLGLMFGVVALSGENPVLFLEEEEVEWLAIGTAAGTDGILSMTRFIRLVLPIGLVGMVLETVVIALIIRYLHRVRPDLVES